MRPIANALSMVGALVIGLALVRVTEFGFYWLVIAVIAASGVLR